MANIPKNISTTALQQWRGIVLQNYMHSAQIPFLERFNFWERLSRNVNGIGQKTVDATWLEVEDALQQGRPPHI